MNLENTIREMITEELDKRTQAAELTPLADWCEKHNLSRVTAWRERRSGRLKTVNIGRKVFVKGNQF